jgi:hypothetical protein
VWAYFRLKLTVKAGEDSELDLSVSSVVEFPVAAGQQKERLISEFIHKN